MKYLAFFIILFAALSAQSQVTKIFLDQNRNVVKDSTKASTYILKEKISDTGWHAREYTLNNAILFDGIYKDEKLSIPDGLVVVYWEGVREIVSSAGYFSNGAKTGTWRTYYRTGEKDNVVTYLNDKKNGVYKKYNSGFILFDGTYLNDQREGEWHTYDKNNNLIVTETYSAGKIINTVRSTPDSTPALGGGVIVKTDKLDPNALRGAVAFSDKNVNIGKIQNAFPDGDFKGLLTKKINQNIAAGINGRLLLEIIIDNDGPVGDVSLMIGTGNDIDRIILDAIPNVCTWHAGSADKKPIIQRVYCVVKISDSLPVVDYFFNITDATKN